MQFFNYNATEDDLDINHPVPDPHHLFPTQTSPICGMEDGYHGLKVSRVNIPVFIHLHRLDLQACHVGTCRVGPMSRFWNEANLRNRTKGRKEKKIVTRLFIMTEKSYNMLGAQTKQAPRPLFKLITRALKSATVS